jgi:glycosyltransferase involved in cell wall biosynthesis
MRLRSPTPVFWIVLACLWFLVTTLAHLEFSLWLVRERTSLGGSFSYKDYVPVVATISGATLLAWLAYDLHKARWRSPVILYWLIWGVCVLLVDAYLTYSPNEYAHYPQYALLAWLIAKGIDPDRTRLAIFKLMFWTTLAGMVDELAQYLWITVSYSDYLDFNDFLVNQLASIAGALLYYGFSPQQVRLSPVRTELRVMLAFALVIALGFGSGRIAITADTPVPPGGVALTPSGESRLYLQRRPDAYGSSAPAPHRGRYWVLDPATGMLLIVLVGGLFSSLPSALRKLPSCCSNSRED